MNNPAQAGRSLAQILEDLREFRASRPQHDLSVFRYRNEGHPFCAGSWVKDDEPVKKSKKRKGAKSENE